MTDLDDTDRYLNLLAGLDALRREAPAIIDSEGEHRGLKVILSRLHQIDDDGEQIRDTHLAALASLAYIEGHSCSRPHFPCDVCEAVEYVDRMGLT